MLSTSNADDTWEGGGFLGKWAGAPYFCCRESSLGLGDAELFIGPRGGCGDEPTVKASTPNARPPGFIRFWLEGGEGFFRPGRPPVRLLVLLGTNDRV